MTKGNKKRKISPMTFATFFFAAVVMMFVGVVGSGFIGISYAVNTSDSLPQTLTVYNDDTFKDYNGPELKDLGFELIAANVVLSTDFYGKDAAGNDFELYCLEKDKGMPNNGTYTKDDDLSARFADKGITYIVSNSFPNNASFMSNYERPFRKAVTQYAIWYYQDLVKGVATNVDGELSAAEKQDIIKDKKYGPLIIDLANRALAANSVTDAADSLSADTSNLSYHISSDEKYLETSYIPVIGSNSLFKNYTVTLENNSYDASIVNEAGQEVTNGSAFVPGTQFKIRVPLEKLKDLNHIDLTAKIMGTFEHKKVYAYRHSQTGAQTALVAAFDNEQVPTEITLKLDVPTGKVSISKQDVTNSKEVPGATLKITDCNGKEVASWVSTDKPHYIDALPVTTNSCKYRLTETIAPDGYELSSETVEFEVKDDGSVTKVVMKNTPLTPTPDTGMNIPFIVYIAGGLILICGAAIIYASVKPKKQK